VAAVGTVCFGAFMGQLDASVVTLTYRPVGAAFGAPLAQVQWLSIAYLAALAGLLVPLGRISDRLGRKRVYLWGFGLFTVASLGCALAPDLGTLVAVRVAQGAGAAMLQANSIALVTTSAPPGRLRAALGVQAAAQAVGLAIGPTLGGLLVQTIGWRWVFAVNVPVGVAAIVLGRYLLPRTRVTVDEAPAGVRELARVPGLLRGVAGSLLGYLVLFGPIVLVPALLQSHGFSPLRAGLITAALPAGFAVASTLGERVLPSGWSAYRRCGCGFVLLGAGLLALLPTAAHPGAAAALAVTGLGLGLFIPANNAQVMMSAPADAVALAGGLVSAARALGTAVGVAVVTATLGRDGAVSVAVLLAAALLAAGTVDRRRLPAGQRPQSVERE
jgi:MFS family permease